MSKSAINALAISSCVRVPDDTTLALGRLVTASFTGTIVGTHLYTGPGAGMPTLRDINVEVASVHVESGHGERGDELEPDEVILSLSGWFQLDPTETAFTVGESFDGTFAARVVGDGCSAYRTGLRRTYRLSLVDLSGPFGRVVSPHHAHQLAAERAAAERLEAASTTPVVLDRPIPRPGRRRVWTSMFGLLR